MEVSRGEFINIGVFVKAGYKTPQIYILASYIARSEVFNQRYRSEKVLMESQVSGVGQLWTWSLIGGGPLFPSIKMRFTVK